MRDPYYDQYRGRGRRNHREPVGCGGLLFRFILKLVLIVVLIAALAAAALYFLPVSIMNVSADGASMNPTRGLPADCLNVLLLGLDVENEGQQRCDCIMVASISSENVKITSFQRDVLVDIPGYDSKHKLNAAYSYGGAELTIRVINQSFGMNITHYIAADFESMVNLVDAVGGIDLEITDKELKWYNTYAYRTYRSLCYIDEEKYSRYLTAADEVKTSGMVHMDGIHAVGYCRIRYADSDFGRTERQRKVLTAFMTKAKSSLWNPKMYAGIIRVINSNLKTNLSIPKMLSLGEKVIGSAFTGKISTYRVPENGDFSDNGSSLKIMDWDLVRRKLYSYIYAK